MSIYSPPLFQDNLHPCIVGCFRSFYCWWFWVVLCKMFYLVRLSIFQIYLKAATYISGLILDIGEESLFWGTFFIKIVLSPTLYIHTIYFIYILYIHIIYIFILFLISLFLYLFIYLFVLSVSLSRFFVYVICLVPER